MQRNNINWVLCIRTDNNSGLSIRRSVIAIRDIRRVLDALLVLQCRLAGIVLVWTVWRCGVRSGLDHGRRCGCRWSNRCRLHRSCMNRQVIYHTPESRVLCAAKNKNPKELIKFSLFSQTAIRLGCWKSSSASSYLYNGNKDVACSDGWRCWYTCMQVLVYLTSSIWNTDSQEKDEWIGLLRMLIGSRSSSYH
jgi:hypothetical protein